jgi:glutamyl-tRNA synthetase
VTQARPFFDAPVEPDPEAVAKHWKDPKTAADRLARLRERLAGMEDWSEGPLEDSLRGLAGELEVGAGKLIHPLRVALTGMAVSPGIFEVLAVMGRDLSLRRIDDAVARLTGGSAAAAAQLERDEDA